MRSRWETWLSKAEEEAPRIQAARDAASDDIRTGAAQAKHAPGSTPTTESDTNY